MIDNDKRMIINGIDICFIENPIKLRITQTTIKKIVVNHGINQSEYFLKGLKKAVNPKPKMNSIKIMVNEYIIDNILFGIN